MAYNPQKIALICQGTFDTLHTGTLQGPKQQELLAAAEDIGNAGFGTVVLGQWHVHADGSVYYNDSRYYPEGTTAPPGALDFDWILTNVPSAMRKAGNVTNIMLEFGGWNCNDCAHMWQNDATFKKTMQEIFDKYPGITGIDFDAEGEGIYTDDTAKGIVSVASWAVAQGKTATCIPYTSNTWWTTDVLEPTVSNKTSAYNWWNLQGASSESYADWVGYVTPYVNNPGNFIVFGFNLDGNPLSPTDMQNTLASAVSNYPHLDGAIIWKYEDITKSNFTVSQYAKALQNGLDGQSGEANASKAA